MTAPPRSDLLEQSASTSQTLQIFESKQKNRGPVEADRTPVCRYGLPNTGAFAPEAVLARVSCRRRENTVAAIHGLCKGVPKRMPQGMAKRSYEVRQAKVSPQIGNRSEWDASPTKKPRAMN
ncbi:hypothetical protein NKI20_09875 [Mesorhizobium sp. M0830]|uniref:hypothetical protein n=1 Tax=Mesorhizobium sp. M0830 TaxID=2957008 RepID=UPI003336AE22